MTEDCTSTTGPSFSKTDDTDCGQSHPLGDSTVKSPECKPWQLTRSADNEYIDSLTQNTIDIAGADFNVYKMLGVHEQSKLVDVTGKGRAISGGALAGFPPINAFTVYIDDWKSLQAGSTTIIASSYIGYDFGDLKTNDGLQRRYSVDTACRKHISAFAIKQSSNPNQRVTKARLERSDDCAKWYGVQIVTLPDDDCLNTILSQGSVPSRYWRLRPIEFTGNVTDRWSVVALQMFHNYEPTYDENVQDMIFLENRNRDYDTDVITIKGTYDLVDVQSELTAFGIELPSQTIYATFSFQGMVTSLGRPLVVGDIVEMPSETQYTHALAPIKKYMEVTDTAWSTEGYTPGWKPTLMRVVLQPAYASEETQDIFGDLAETDVIGGLGLQSEGDGRHPLFQDYSTASQTVIAEADDNVPQRGADISGIAEISEAQLEAAAELGIAETLAKRGANSRGYQVEDAMPPNNKPFTEGDEFPANPTNGDYHRVTYTATSDELPVRLYRWSGPKSQWIFLEKDRRTQNNSALPILNEFLNSPNKVPYNSITKSKEDC